MYSRCQTPTKSPFDNSAGTNNHTDDEDLTVDVLPGGDREPDFDALIKVIREEDANFALDEDWGHSNTNYILLGILSRWVEQMHRCGVTLEAFPAMLHCGCVYITVINLWNGDEFKDWDNPSVLRAIRDLAVLAS